MLYILYTAVIVLLCICDVTCWLLEFCLFAFPACLHVACVVQQKDARQWFAELSVDMEKVGIFVLLSLTDTDDTVGLR